ncbi:mechanosensitive ion channel domain-containing protein [Pontibacter sp. G13]|uniref:mechanosensitive ion channel family protein n=1 Tax=Pontibacter sp. G13 TaxID=3074898 RepID=UPI00288C5C4D|nr:mechanosensitive ion channel domain-containing protein [Pontibacter sp. G13]WNJ17884.1 mechanosensitive ion channel [Pontibacter sp. G13]
MKGLKLFAVIGWVLMGNASLAQTVQAPVSSGDSSKTVSIPVEEIPAYSLRTESKLDEILESLLSETLILSEKAKSDSIVSRLDSLLAIEQKVDYNRLLSRELVNKRSFWSGYEKVLNEQLNTTEKYILDLSSKSKEVNDELRVWLQTEASIDTFFTDSLYRLTIHEVIRRADSFSKIILTRTNICFSMLKGQKHAYYQVDNLLLEIKEITRSRQQQVLAKTHPSLFDLNYDNPADWDLAAMFKSFTERNVQIMARFYREQAPKIFLFIAYILTLIGIFLYIHRRNRGTKLAQDNVYLRAVGTILQSPISVAIILGVFTSELFLPDRPPILIDLSILLLTVPIIDIVSHVSDKEGKIYLYTFGALILLRFLNYVFPPDSPLHRYNLLIMGVLELVILITLIRNLNIQHLTSGLFNQFVRLIIFTHIIASAIGLLTNITGHLRVAEITVDLAITNTLVGLLLIISTLVIIGLIQLAIDGKFLNKFHYVRKRREVLKQRTTFIMMLAFSLLWINYILQILRIQEPVYQFVLGIFGKKFTLGSISFSLGSVVAFFVVIWLSVQLSRLVNAILQDDVLTRVTLGKGVPRMISAIVQFSLISVGILLAVTAVGLPLDQLTIIVSAFSVGIGFGLQNIVNNFVSGIILLFERPVQIGDTVEVNNLVGSVKSMGIRSSNIQTFDGAEVVVPNANLISNELINWTLSDKRRRIEIMSGVAYGSDVHHVQKLLADILTQHPDVLQDPEPLVLFNDLGDSSLDFRLLFWTDQQSRWTIIKSEVIFKIYDTLNEANIEIPFPQRDLHIRSNDAMGEEQK